MKVLIVDDSKMINLMVSEMLVNLGHQAESAMDGNEAVEYFKSGKNADLILLDWNMPNMSGLEFLEFNSSNNLTSTPIVMMTTENKPDYIARALELGAVEYIMKPFTDDILEMKIKEALED